MVSGDLRGGARCIYIGELRQPMFAGYGPHSVTIDAMLEAQAAAGRSTRESTAATMHRQPTPGSIAAAEVKLVDRL